MGAVQFLGADGLPMPRADGALAPVAGSGLPAASGIDAGALDWSPFAGSADADLLFDRPSLVAKQRDLVRRHGLASAGMQTFVDNILGADGLRLIPKPSREILGWTPEEVRTWSKKVRALFEDFASGSDFECDATGRSDLHGLAVQNLRGAMGNGDACGVPLWDSSRGRRWYTTLQLVESDRLCNPNGRMNSARFRDGVEINGRGRPVAFHIRSSHPGDVFMAGAGAATWERIPARTAWGRRRFLHLMDVERVGQSRGRPCMSTILGDFKTLEGYRKATLDSATINAMVAAVLESPMDGATIADLFGGGEAYLGLRNDAPQVKMQRGTLARLFPGEKLSSYNPGTPDENFEAFMATMLHQLAAGMNLPYVLLTKDFSKTNYSSARAALLEAWRYFMGRRAFLAKYWYQPVYELWLEEAVGRGIIEAPGFWENKGAYCRAEWRGPGRGSVDPLKEAKGTEIDLATGVTSLAREAAERGEDWEEVMEQRAAENARAEELGLPQPHAGQAAPALDPKTEAAMLADDDETDDQDEET